MKPFNTLTVGEIKALSTEDIEKYSLEVGDQVLDDLETRTHVCRMLGRAEINRQITHLKGIDRDLTGR